VLSKDARPKFLLSPMSGRAAALAMLEEVGLHPSASLVDRLLMHIRQINRTVDGDELKQLVDALDLESAGSRAR
jgi:hypothetical protein